jgi:DNA replication protein DnaC
MKHSDTEEYLREKLRWLRLPGMLECLSGILDEARKSNLTPIEVADRLCDAEKVSRKRRSIDRKISSAKFPEINTVDGFDFEHDATRKKIKGRYLALCDMSFLERGVNPLFLGKPGTGKTFLARSLAYAACQAQKKVVVISAPKMLNALHGAEIHGLLDRVMRRYLNADLLFIDDFAVLAMDAAQAKLAFQVISERYEYRRSTMITTNRAFKDWAKVFPDALNAQVIAERLTERSEHFVMNGKPFGTRGGGKILDG